MIYIITDADLIIAVLEGETGFPVSDYLDNKQIGIDDLIRDHGFKRVDHMTIEVNEEFQDDL
jgi:hypothetical protein